MKTTKKTSKKATVNEQREWILPCNTSFYDIDNALVDLKIIDWRQTKQLKNAQVGDIIYIYCKRKNISEISYKGAILAVNKTENIIDDSKYSSDRLVSVGPCIEIAVFRVYELTGELTYAKLKENGLLSRLQGPTVVKGTVADYLHECDEKQCQVDRFLGDIADCCCFPFPIAINEITSAKVSKVCKKKEKERIVEEYDRPPYISNPNALRKLTYSNFSFFGSTEIKIWITDNKVHYSKNYVGKSGENIKDLVSAIKEETFIRKLADIDIPSWKKKYEPKGFLVMDGESWTVKYEKENGKILKCSGENEYPPNWKSFMILLKDIVGDF